MKKQIAGILTGLLVCGSLKLSFAGDAGTEAVFPGTHLDGTVFPVVLEEYFRHSDKAWKMGLQKNTWIFQTLRGNAGRYRSDGSFRPDDL